MKFHQQIQLKCVCCGEADPNKSNSPANVNLALELASSILSNARSDVIKQFSESTTAQYPNKATDSTEAVSSLIILTRSNDEHDYACKRQMIQNATTTPRMGLLENLIQLDETPTFSLADVNVEESDTDDLIDEQISWYTTCDVSSGSPKDENYLETTNGPEISYFPNASANVSELLSTPQKRHSHVRALDFAGDFDCTPNRFRLAEINVNKIGSGDVLSPFLTEDIINLTGGRTESTGGKNHTENLPEKLFATDDDRSESERSIMAQTPTKFPSASEESKENFETSNERDVNVEPDNQSNQSLPAQQNMEVRSDPTQKASNLLISSLFDEKERRKKMNIKEQNESTSCSSKILLKKITIPKIPIKHKETKKRHSNEIEGKNAEPKEKKIKTETHDDIPCGFGHLSLEQLKKYDVNEKYFEVEKGQGKKIIASIKEKMSNSTSNLTSYIKAYRSMLYMEEAAETLKIHEFNQRRVKLVYSNAGNKFELKKSVS